MAGRRTSLAALAGQKVDDVPGQSDLLLLSLPLDKLVPTRFNPRRRFGTDEELAEFGRKLAKKQLQPAVVVSRAAYLKLWPDEAERVGSVPYVIANGERRYRASLLVNRPTIDVVHNEDVAASRADFLDAVQSENNDRENLDPIERAIAIETMVTELDGADRVAVYYDKTKGWVSQQRKLLKLTAALQDLVSAGEMPVRIGRDIAGLPAERQMAAWEAELESRAAAKAAPRKDRTTPPLAPQPEPARFTAVNRSIEPKPDTPSPAADPAPRFTAVNQQPPPPDPQSAPSLTLVASASTETEPPADVIPEPRAHRTEEQDPAGSSHPKRLPYDDGPYIAQHLALKMQDDAHLLMIRVSLEKALERNPQAYFQQLLTMLQKAQEQDPQELAVILTKLGVTAS